jgi:hypothetical protein
MKFIVFVASFVFALFAVMAVPSLGIGAEGTVVLEDCAACQSRPLLDLFVNAAVDKDLNTMNHMLALGRCFPLPVGQRVVNVKTHGLGIKSFRIPGQSRRFWTISEAIH